MTYHISSKGPALCKASVKDCPYGASGEPHFETREEAEQVFQTSMIDQYGMVKTVKRKTFGIVRLTPIENAKINELRILKSERRKRMTKIALAAASLAMLTACSMDGNAANWPKDHPEDQASYSATVKPSEQNTKGPLISQETKDKAHDTVKELGEKAGSTWQDLKDTYGDDWKDTLSEGLDSFLEYAENYEAPAPSSQAHSEYDRDAFKHWTDTSLYNNNCDTRQDILERDLSNVVLDSEGCIVSGTLHDPYTGKTIQYTRGDLTIDIDHVVPLGDSWAKGSNEWSDAKREAFANDPDNLLAVDASANRSKSDSSPSEWMPVNQSYACSYGLQYLKVSKKYDLMIEQADVASVNLACK